ncbi:HWE histidine kinase domain-containing protein [Pseudooceanicola onchidii]|uniref:HWE histidine kinase domain-containing protein n=1 Tax=Pseudooceanicola onchidii TaxID=2562279 RepID=UPI0010AB27E8|nr:HWE histidine kinase domain-containing protein [Pseudooceanicola onchidii]
MSDAPSQVPDQAVDLTTCDREPIHIPGRIQHYGCLLAVSSDWIIAHASENCGAILGVEATDTIGVPFVDFFSRDVVHYLRSRLQILARDTGNARIYAYDLFGDGRLFDISVHNTGRFLIFEFEPRLGGAEMRDDTAIVQALIARVQRHSTLEKMTTEAARSLKALTGIDRVMVYRFEPDDTGTVIAEATEPNMEAYLGLRYPASDIPKQARALYVRNVLRIIPDVQAETFAIHPTLGPEGQPLDLSLAVTRAVSPIHLEYLRNMGVGASMSVSILRKGKLWGLFACHHRTAFHMDFQKRSAIELFVQLFNYELARLETDQELEEVNKARDMHDRMMQQISDERSLVDSFDTVADELEQVIAYDGIAVYSNGFYRARGSTPTAEEFLGLARFLNTTQTAQIYATDRLGDRYPAAEDFADRAAGLLVLPISRTPRDYIVLFRREVAQSVTWAGNPDKPVTPGPNGLRLTPRKSFDAWREVVRGSCVAWRSGELRAAEALRVTLLEVVLKLTDESSANSRRAQEQQELLIAELNHRVRNILNLIRGLVSQSRAGADSILAYGQLLDARIHALARAHDQLTERSWNWVSLSDLIDNEVRAFLAGKADRVKVSGDKLDLSPTAFTTLALVIHELVTNSAKYGALNDSRGSVEISMRLAADGTAYLSWRERNGPPVQAPTRRGFGTTIIERSIPFELKGTAELHYKASGLEADFMIPAIHVQAGTVDPAAPKEVVQKKGSVRIEGAAMVLEDNMIIAMDASDILSDMGCSTVHPVSRVSEALRLLEAEEIAFALLDVNLGDETSLDVARLCKDRGIRAVLATGYGGNGDLLDGFPDFPVLRKPYTAETLAAILSEDNADQD